MTEPNPEAEFDATDAVEDESQDVGEAAAAAAAADDDGE